MELTNQDKMGIVENHLRASLVNSYSLQISIIEERSMPSPNQETVAALEGRLEIELARQSALDKELQSLKV
jgi:hypothetical protein